MRTRHEYDIKLVPVISELDHPLHVWEHPPVDYYGHGEYPRWLRKPGANAPQVKEVRTIKPDCRCIECQMKRSDYKEWR